MLKDRKILLGVTAGIAAYKAAFLTRLFVKAGAEVRVVMTPDSEAFISPLTLATLSKNPVEIDFYEEENGSWTNHVELGAWADVFLIAPLTANTLAKFANGLCDNLLTAVYLSAKCPVAFAPAMDLDMYAHPSTQKNIQTLQSYGNHFIPAAEGELASGLVGKGRLPEPEDLFKAVESLLDEKKKPSLASQDSSLKGQHFLITAGPTRESIDPVRFITNHSTGTMGTEIAKSLLARKAKVTLVHGPLSVAIPSGVEAIAVSSADEMLKACEDQIATANAFIATAAVADYTPIHLAENKIKKGDEPFKLELKRTVDILATISQNRPKGCLIGGFALETQNGKENALKKLENKNMDFIVLNLAKKGKSGFGKGNNTISIFSKDKIQKDFPSKPKPEVAEDIVNFILENFYA